MPNITEKNFRDMLKEALNESYLTSYSEQTEMIKNPRIRGNHGVTHAIRTSIHTLVLLDLYAKAGLDEAIRIQQSKEDLICLQFAALYHDAGRKNDGADCEAWEEEGAVACINFLKRQGISEHMAEKYAKAAQYKDSRDKGLLQKIIHDADCLEVLRVRETFDPTRLQAMDDLPEEQKIHLQKYINQVRDIIATQGDLRKNAEITGDSPLPGFTPQEVRKYRSRAKDFKYQEAIDPYQLILSEMRHHISYIEELTPPGYDITWQQISSGEYWSDATTISQSNILDALRFLGIKLDGKNARASEDRDLTIIHGLSDNSNSFHWLCKKIQSLGIPITISQSSHSISLNSGSKKILLQRVKQKYALSRSSFDASSSPLDTASPSTSYPSVDAIFSSASSSPLGTASFSESSLPLGTAFTSTDFSESSIATQNFQNFLQYWRLSPDEFEESTRFLSSRSDTALANPVGAPIKAKLHRRDSTAKYNFSDNTDNVMTKTGIKAQCTSFINEGICALPYQGAGDLFLIPIEDIAEDISHKRSSIGINSSPNPAIFSKDAWTTRVHSRISAGHKESTKVQSDFAGLREMREPNFLNEVPQNSLSQLVNNLSQPVSYNLKSSDDFKARNKFKFVHNATEYDDKKTLDNLRRSYKGIFYVNIEVDATSGDVFIKYKAKNGIGQSLTEHKLSLDEFIETSGREIPRDMPHDQLTSEKFIKSLQEDILQLAVNKGHVPFLAYPNNTIFIKNKSVPSNSLEVIVTDHRGRAGKMRSIDIQEIVDQYPELDFKELENPQVKQIIIDFLSKEGCLKKHYTEIDSDLRGDMLLASFYRYGPSLAHDHIGQFKRKLECLTSRKLHELYGIGDAIGNYPIIFFSEEGKISRDTELENEELATFFIAYLKEKERLDGTNFDLSIEIKQFVEQFFFTGVNKTESFKFVCNDQAKNFIFDNINKQLCHNFPEQKSKIRHVFSQLNHQILTQTKVQELKVSAREDIFKLHNKFHDQIQSRPALGNTTSQVEYIDLDSPDGEKYRLEYPQEGTENLWKPESKVSVYTQEILKTAQDNDYSRLVNILPTQGFASDQPIQQGIWIDENNMNKIVVVHTDGKQENLDISQNTKGEHGIFKLNNLLQDTINSWKAAAPGGEEKASLSKKIVELALKQCTHCPISQDDISLFARPSIHKWNKDSNSFEKVRDLEEVANTLKKLL